MSPQAKTILIVEDEAAVREPLAAALAAAEFRVLESDVANVAFHLFQSAKPDLVILDLSLADGSGLEVCRKMRAHPSLAATPVIMITGKGKLEEKESGFEAGADHYLVKPVIPRELLMWVQALLKRPDFAEDEGGILKAGDLAIDVGAHLVKWRDAVVSELTGKEFDLFYFLVKKRPKVLSRQHILSNLWHTVAVDNLVDTHLGNLRRKLPPEVADKLQAVPGKGFRYFG